MRRGLTIGTQPDRISPTPLSLMCASVDVTDAPQRQLAAHAMRLEKGWLNGVSEESNGVPTSFRYVCDRLLEAAWDLPSAVSWDEAAEVSFTACS